MPFDLLRMVPGEPAQGGSAIAAAIDPGGKAGGDCEKEAGAAAESSPNQWFFTSRGVLGQSVQLLPHPQTLGMGFGFYPPGSSWKVPRYEPFRPNQIWGEDWTLLSIDSLRHYLLTIIDYFSRYIVAWGIVRTVTRLEVQNLLALAYLSEGIKPEDSKPLLRADLGSPNIAHSTRRLIRDLEMVLSFSRPHRPTDNGRQERWYRTVKQEEIYCYPTYPTIEIARLSLSRYIRYYNEQRPHQALWNYPPGYVHRLGNKSKLLAHYKTMVHIVKEQRLQINQRMEKNQIIAVSN